MYLAEIAVLSRDLDAAETDARAAVTALEVAPPLRAAALAVLARSLIGLDRAPEAVAAAGEAHAILESLGGIEEGESLVRLVYAEAFQASGDTAAFKAAIESARERVMVRAMKISDPAWRERFLNGVPDNVRTLELAGTIPEPTA